MGSTILLAVISLAVSLALVVAEPSSDAATKVPPAGFGPVYSLDQFGPVATPAEAEQTFRKASADVFASGGGVIVIPAQTAPSFRPKNNNQGSWRRPPPPETAKSWGTGAGVTVVDARGGTVKVTPPQMSGLEIERVLDMKEGDSLPFWGLYPILKLKNTVLRGSCSYRDWLQEDVQAGKDRRFYVATIRGVFPGEFMAVMSNNGVPRLWVKSIGYDKEKKLWYFVADTDVDCQKGNLMGNKNHVNVLDMETYSHNENQTFDVRMWRHNYSQGDNYLFDARFRYMGDVHSTGGDENGVIYAAFVQSLTNIFSGEVEAWNPASGELKYRGSDGSTLGTGRPIINLNPAKWVTAGTVMIARPASWTDYGPNQSDPVFQGKTYPTTLTPDRVGVPGLRMGGLIRFSADAPVTDEAVGRYFAVDEQEEYVPGGPRRWYLIDSVAVNADGTKDIRIIRHWWGAKSAGSPTLYKPENYSWDGHEKPLKYIIAPGANVYDVSDGVKNPKSTIRLVPTALSGTTADFALGDRIEQAIGPDPFKPVPFRSWMWDQVPGAFPAPVFDIANVGSSMRDSLLWVHGNSSGDIEKDRAAHYDRNPPWDKLLSFDSTCNTGIKFGADTASAAILFAQPNGREQPVKWRYGAGNGQPPQEASLTVSCKTGEMNFTGGARFGGAVVATGVSADKEPSHNLRGKNVPVKAGETTVAVAFPVEEADPDYAVFIEQSWLSNRAVVKKESKGFTVQFEKPAPDEAKLDWMIVR
jgi:hypothetical protein